MPTLTTSWQNVASYVFQPGTGFKATFYLDAKYSTQSKENLTTTVQTRLNCTVNQGSGSGSGYRFALSYANTKEGSALWYIETETILTGESTIKHNDDGTKSITLSASMRVNYTGLDASMSATVTLPAIDTYPTLTGAQDFTDEGNPKITFTKNLGYTNPTVQAGIYNSAGTTAYVTRTIPNADVKANGEYTFNLTENERNTLRNAIPSANSMQVKFRLITTASGTAHEGSTIAKTMTITNANPTLSTPTITETNSKVTALLGTSASTIVQNASVVTIATTPSAKKGASISKVELTHNGATTSDTSSPYSFSVNVKANSFSLKATDSRNNQSSVATITRTGSNYIEYKPVAINSYSFKRQSATSGVILLTLDATYYQKTFGSTANAPIVKWKKGSGSWTTLTSSQYTIDTTNNKIKVTNLSLGDILPYTSGDTFYIYIEDKLSTVQNNINVPRGQATLELGENDAIINGKIDVLTLKNSTQSTDTYLTTNASWANKKIAFGIGSGGTNRGIWDYTLNKWTFYNDENNLYCNGNTTTNGSMRATKGFYSRPTGEVGTATSDSNSMLLIKRATNSEAPNNGVVLEYGNSSSWRGQLFIGDNSTQGIYFNGWSNGTRGTWRRLAEEQNITTGGSAVPTGRVIDGKREYVKRIQVNGFGASGVDKSWSTGLSMTNIIITDIKVTGLSGSGNWFVMPNNDSTNCRTQINADGKLHVVMFQGNWEGKNGYAEIHYYHTS